MDNSTDLQNETLDEMSSDDLERKLEDTRASISEKMQILQDELEPKKLVNTGIEYVREKVDFEDTMEFITSNPLPVVLTATGLVWLAVAYQDRSHKDGYQEFDTLPGGYANSSLNESLPASSIGSLAELRRDAALRRRAAVPMPRRLHDSDMEPTVRSSGGQPVAVVLAGLGVGLLAGLYLS